ncbi:MAG: hypothetical protein Q4B99_06785 [Clostridia bacterium]|nr:hypothetical protein [Clostridia bacterium]
MRCSCKKCGTYMVQEERGLGGCCVCPECANRCRDCVSADEKPASPEALKALYASMLAMPCPEADERGANSEDEPDCKSDWTRFL